MADSNTPLLGATKAAVRERASLFFFVAVVIAAMGSFNFGCVLGFSSPTFVSNQRDNSTNASMSSSSSSFLTAAAAAAVASGSSNNSNGGSNESTLCPIFAESFTGVNHDKINCELQLSNMDVSWFNGIFNLAAGAGAILLGPFVPVIGKRFSMVLSAVLFTGGWILIILCPTPSTPWNGMNSSAPEYPTIIAMLYSGRVLLGFGIGLACCSVTTYLVEIAPVHMRGAIGTAFQMGVVVGIFFAYLIGSLVVWRELSWICFGLTSSAALLCLCLPESPIWLVSKGRDEQARSALNRLRNTSSGASVDELLVDVSASASSGSEGESGGGLKLLLSDKTARKALWIGIGLMFLQQFSGINAVMLYCGSIFQTKADVDTANLMGTGVQAVQVVVTVLSAFFMDRAGRVPILLWASIGMTICAGLLATTYMVEMPAAVSFASVFGYILFFSSGMGAIPWSIMGEIFDPRVQGVASSIATAVNWFLSFIISFSVLPLSAALKSAFPASFLADHKDAGLGALFFIYAIVCFLGTIFVWAKVPETKNKSIAQIQAELRGEKSGYDRIN